MKLALTLLTGLLLTACSFNKMYLKPTKAPPLPQDRDEITFTSATAEGTTFVAFKTSTLQPTFLNSSKDSIHFDYTIESVIFKSSSGNNLNGWLLKPKNVIPKITLLHFHGNSGFILSQYQAMTPLLKLGFQAFIFDYSGFGFSEGKATRDNILLDGNSALTYLKNREEVKDTKLIIYGQSLGGHLATVVAQQRQAEIDGLVIEGAFSSHKDIAAESAGIFGRILVREKYSAIKAIKNYHKPLLVIHSTEDKTIPFEMGEQLFAQANEPKDFYQIEKCHICGTRFYADNISDRIKKMHNKDLFVESELGKGSTFRFTLPEITND